jgi:uncharacterized membrane protein YjfL (UPF0719 family)
MRGNRHYVHLAIMIVLSFVSMYILMYVMVNRFANVYSNLNQFYMAGLMTAPIVVIELALMGSVMTTKTPTSSLLQSALSLSVPFSWGLGNRPPLATRAS